MELLVLGLFITAVVGILAAIFNSPSRKGARGERIVAYRLRSGLSEEYQILNDVYLPLADGSTTQIDHIVVCQSGIFVVETKNYSGWIFGNENSAKWTQTIYHCKHSFQNPIRQNYRHICALSDNLKIPKDYFKSVVAFTGDCDFRTEMPEGVVYSRNAAQYIRSFTIPRIKPDQVPEIVSAIRSWQGTVSEERKDSHVQNLKKRHSAVHADSPSPKCPFCGGDMVVRHRRSDGAAFYGCRKYPNCKGIINIAK